MSLFELLYGSGLRRQRPYLERQLLVRTRLDRPDRLPRLRLVSLFELLRGGGLGRQRPYLERQLLVRTRLYRPERRRLQLRLVCLFELLRGGRLLRQRGDWSLVSLASRCSYALGAILRAVPVRG